MQIIKATDYGFRVVIRVNRTPELPEWVHTVGAQWRDDNGGLMFDNDGSPVLIDSPNVPAGETGEACHNCHYNWNVYEAIFDGLDLFYSGEDGNLIRRSNDDLVTASFTRAAKPPEPDVMGGLLGLTG